jgi:uncharacterized glyoxalase superfamily protein PhnB
MAGQQYPEPTVGALIFSPEGKLFLMNSHNRYPVRKVEMMLTVPSIEGTVAWYECVLGWVGHYDVFDAEGRCLFGSVMCGDLESVMQGKETFRGFNLSRFSEGTASYSQGCANFSALIFVDDVEAVYARAVENEATVDGAPENQLWGGRTFSMQDLNGFRLTFVQMVESVTLEEIRQRHLARGQ